MKRTLPKPTLLELDEYDINQRLIEALTTTCSHAILFSIVGEEKDAIQIAGQLQISLSSVYKTLVNLEKLSLIEIQRFHINSDNKKIKMYRSKIKKRLLTFVVVGGGFAGVETAGEINDFLHEAISYYHNIERDDILVTLIEAGTTILPGFNDNLSKYAHNRLEKNGIKISLQNAVMSFDGKNVNIKKLSDSSSESTIDSHTLIWTAGVTPVEIIQNSAFKLKNGKIIVNEFLEIPNHPGIFAIGDCSQFDSKTNNKFPPTAQLAEAHAKLTAYNIKQIIENKEKKKFEYRWKGQSAVIGKRYGIAEAMGMKITGFWAWLLWRNYYLTKMPNIEKRVRVWLDWNIDLFSRIDISRYGFKRDTSKEYRELDEVDDVW